MSPTPATITARFERVMGMGTGMGGGAGPPIIVGAYGRETGAAGGIEGGADPVAESTGACGGTSSSIVRGGSSDGIDGRDRPGDDGRGTLFAAAISASSQGANPGGANVARAAVISSADGKRARTSRATQRANHASKPCGRKLFAPRASARSLAGAIGSFTSSE